MSGHPPNTVLNIKNSGPPNIPVIEKPPREVHFSNGFRPNNNNIPRRKLAPTGVGYTYTHANYNRKLNGETPDPPYKEPLNVFIPPPPAPPRTKKWWHFMVGKGRKTRKAKKSRKHRSRIKCRS